MQELTSNTRSSKLLTATLIVLTTSFAAAPGFTDTPQSTLVWLPQAQAWLDEQAQQHHAEAIVTSAILPLDPRLRLKPCTQPTFQMPSGNLRGRVSLKVSCQDGQTNWSIFLPAQISLSADVAITRQPMARGAVLHADDISLQHRDVTQQRNGWLQPEQVTGMALKRPLPAGSLLNDSVLESPVLIRRGDAVVVRSNRGGITIEAAGVALAAGAAGEPIRIRNDRSERVVRGWVASAGVVATDPPN